MTGYDDKLRNLENLFQQKGIPTLCHLLGNGVTEPYNENPISEPGLEVVFPMNMEVEIHRVLRDERGTLLRSFGPDVEVVIRTILYHLSSTRFGKLSSDLGGYFISTNIKNLSTPTEKNLSESEVCYEYDVDVVAVGVTCSIADGVTLINKIKETSKAFNNESRYLKIRKLRIAFTESRMLLPGAAPLDFQEHKI